MMAADMAVLALPSTIPPYVSFLCCGEFGVRFQFSPHASPHGEKAKPKGDGSRKIPKAWGLGTIPLVIAASNEICSCASHGARATEIVSAGKGDVAQGIHQE